MTHHCKQKMVFVFMWAVISGAFVWATLVLGIGNAGTKEVAKNLNRVEEKREDDQKILMEVKGDVKILKTEFSYLREDIKEIKSLLKEKKT